MKMRMAMKMRTTMGMSCRWGVLVLMVLGMEYW